MQITLMDLPVDRVNLLPLTYLKSISDLRIGIVTIREKWNLWLGSEPSVITSPYLQPKYAESSGEGFLINSTVLPDAPLVEAIRKLPLGQQLVVGDTFVAAHVADVAAGESALEGLSYSFHDAPISQIRRPWDIFLENPSQIDTDYDLLTKGRNSASIDDPHTIRYGSRIFCEEGVSVKAAILNAEDGPIYLGKGVKIQEGSIVQGPVAMCDNSQLSLGAKIRPNVTIGPHCKVGGEVSKSVIQGFSNKSHDGFLGNAVIGEWCNLGAATNNSNLKNNYNMVKMWDFATRRFKDSGQQFCGLIMGDHSKCAINTTFNTGTTTGILTNIYGAGFPRNYIPSFAWGGTGGFSTYRLDKAIEGTSKAMERRGASFSEEDLKILQHIFDETARDRTWERKG